MTTDQIPDSFRYEVLAMARRLYPGAVPGWNLGPDRAVVMWGDLPIYLGNLNASLRELGSEEREQAIRDWLKPFNREAEAKYEAALAATDDWSNAKHLLRPRLQSQVVARDNAWMIRQPFSPALVITYTLDLGDRDAYVLEKKLAGWSISIDEVHTNALANLESMSADIPLLPERHEGLCGSYLMFETGDGYDAARLLLPGFRARLLEAMGPSLLAGAPGRGLLYIWTPDLGLRPQIEDMVRRDAVELPYPLSSEIFAFDAEGLRLAEIED